ALDQDKSQVDSITSNMAHLLWCGVPFPAGQLSLAHDSDGTKVIEAPPGLRLRRKPGFSAETSRSSAGNWG
ncbi:MAG: hypothetical protein WBV74_11565, partial [Pseudonocardiaceae bacterium]